MVEDQHQILEDVKKLLKDINQFFSVTLVKKEKLKKDTVAEKDRLFGQIKETLVKLEGEEPQEEYDDASSYMHAAQEDDSGMIYDDTEVETLKPLLSHDNISHTGSQKSSENDDDNDEDKGDVNYDGTRIRPKSISELGQSLRDGYLDKKRKEGQFAFSTWQSRYCIIKDNMMYYYKSKTDGKQCNEVNLSGYSAVSSPDIEKKHKRRQFLFVVSQPGCRSFQFIAQSQEDMQLWIEAIDVASKMAPRPPASTSGGDSVSMSGEGDFGEDYEDLDDYQQFKIQKGKQTASLPNPPPIAEEKDYGDEYEELSDYQKFKLTQAAPLPSPPKEIPSFEEVCQEADDFGDEYEDLEDYQKFKKVQRNEKQSNAKQNEPSPDFGDTYDDVSVLPKPVDSTMSVRHTALPPTPAESPMRDRPLPPPRDLPAPPSKESKTNGKDELEPWDTDYKNIYVGKWDCQANEDNELEFNRGELIHILSQEYGGWWIGEKNYKVGLVPKDFIMEAYVSK